MKVPQAFQQVLQKPVSRKEFLQQVGVVVLAVLGANTILHFLKGGSGHSEAGYGFTPFGN